MTGTQVATITPLIIVSAAPVFVMMLVVIRRSHVAAVAITLVALAAAFGSLFYADSTGVHEVTNLLIVDKYALFYMGLIFVTAFAVAGLSYRYLDRIPGEHEEYYALLLMATTGSAVLVCSRHFASFFLGLEVLSVSLYALISYPRRETGNVEAAVKYVILAATSSTFLLFGMALVYGELGTMQFDQIVPLRATVPNVSDTLLIVGFGLLIVGFGFKLAVVPFHMWTPDIYQGAPAPVSGYVATVSKGAMFALLLRFYSSINFHSDSGLFWAFGAIAVASMFTGNILALLQSNLKRILAYSSIAHLGYLLVAFLASGSLVATAVSFYLAVYFAATLAAFGVVAVLSNGERDAEDIEDYRGLFWRRPVLAAILALSMLSLAGIPFTGGFIGKFYLVTSGADSALWALVIILVLTSVIGLFYYLRVIGAMYGGGPEEAPAAPLAATVEGEAWTATRALPGGIVLLALTGVVVWLGVYPRPLIHIIQTLVGGIKIS